MLFVSDLDGTLLGHTHDIDDVVLSGIREVLAKGHYFVLCTGRPMHEEGAVNFGIRHEHIYTIAMNGALIYDGSGNIIESVPIEKEVIKTFYHNLGDALVRYESSDCALHPFSRQRVDDYLFEDGLSEKVGLYKKENMGEHDYFGIKFDDILSSVIYKINIVAAKPHLREKVDALLAKYGDALINAPWNEGFYDITDIKVNKAVATKSLANKLGFDDKDIYVYGDSYNDVKMLKMFSNSASPSNANEEAKAAAKRIIGDYDEHSVIKDILAKI